MWKTLVMWGALGAGAAMGQESPRAERIPFPDGQHLFVSGANVPWIDFGRDVGPSTLPGCGDETLAFPDKLRELDRMFSEVARAGGNGLRLWVHVDGSCTPFGVDGQVVPLRTAPPDETLRELEAILDVAATHNLHLILVLWSRDMLVLRDRYGEIAPHVVVERAHALLTDDASRRDYLHGVLRPMVARLGSHEALLAWEILNEPELMSREFRRFVQVCRRPGELDCIPESRLVSMREIRRFVNAAAHTIHEAATDQQVTVGAWSMRSLARGKNAFSDVRLLSVPGALPLGTLDFYSVHDFNYFRRRSPFGRDCGEWRLDKPLVVTEFCPCGERYANRSTDELLGTLYERGYAGGLWWSKPDADRERGDCMRLCTPDDATREARILERSMLELRDGHRFAIEPIPLSSRLRPDRAGPWAPWIH